MNNEQLKINKNISDSLNNKSLLTIIRTKCDKNNNDIDLKGVFKIMNINNGNEIYNEQFKHINIILNEEQSQKRYDIIMTIKKFIIENEINTNIFYYIIYIFDLLIIKNNKFKLISSFEKMGLGALFISIKFFHENNNNLSIGNKKYKSLYNNRYYSMHEIIKLEVLCLKLINYCLTRPSVINFIELLISKGILYDSDLNNNNIGSNYNDTFNHLYFLIFKNLDFVVLYSNDYIKYNPFYLSCFIIGLSRNILNMEKYPKPFRKFFKLTISSFNEIYNELWQKFKNILNNKNKDKRNNTKKNYLASLYLKKHLKEVESQSFLHVKKNLNYYYNLEILNSEINQNLSCRKDNNAHNINPFLNRKISLKHDKQNTFENNGIKKINKNENKYIQYSSQPPAPLQRMLQNCSIKVKNLYKFNPSLFSEYLNSSTNNNNINSLNKSKPSHCFKKSIDKIEFNGNNNLKENKDNNEMKKLENSRENKKDEKISNLHIYNSSKKFIKNRTAIKFIFKDNENKDINENNYNNIKKEEKNLYKEENNLKKKYKFTKSKSSLNWIFDKNKEKEIKKEKDKEEEMKEINKNEKEEISKNENENEKIKKYNYLVSIRTSYKKKKKNNCNQNIHMNRINNINKYNIHTENDSKNEEEKNMNFFSFKRKYTEKIEKKINDEQYNKNNGKINQIINDNKTKLSKMANKFEDINNKRINIRMFYKLKNSNLKNGKKYNYE